MQFINCTPHALALNSGEVFPPSGQVARVSVRYGNPDKLGIFPVSYGAVEGLPAPRLGVMYIVSGMVLEPARAQGRRDVVAPATGHPDTQRNAQGHIISVPGWQ